MRVALVTGSQMYEDRARVWRTLDRDRPELVIHGACGTGVDRFAHEWAETMGVPVLPMPAMWSRDGRQAGPARNLAMASLAKALAQCGHGVRVHAFPLGRSAGTRSCVVACRSRGLSVTEHAP